MQKNPLLFGLIVFSACTFSSDGCGTAKAGFTGPNVPQLGTMNGDLDITGVTLANGRANIPQLVGTLQRLHETDFFQVIQPDNSESWSDFQLMAPVFQQAGIHLWAYLYPQGLSTPYNGDYVTWGKQIATIGTQYPMVAGLAIDDFSENTSTFTTSYLKTIMNAAHAIDPSLALLATTYYDQRTRIASAVRAGAIDGVLFPYRIQQNSTEYFQDTSQLAPQISSFRSYLDQQTALGHLSKQMPLVTMVYAEPLSYSTDAPTPSYVQTCLTIGKQQTAAGLTNGVMTYELPKDDPAFMPADPVTLPFSENFQSRAPSADAFLDYPSFTATGVQSRTVDATGVLRLGNGPVPAADFFTVTPAGYAPGSELVIKIDMGFDGQAAFGGTALRLGDNTIVFHPGYNWPPGSFRVEGLGGLGSSDMGWLPQLGVLNHVEVDSFPNGLFIIKVTDGTNPAHVYTTSFTNPASYGGEIGPAAVGDGSAIFDNLSITLANTTEGVGGDYNGNGVVDMADYVLWRNGGPLQNEIDKPGVVDGGDYVAWRTRFGNTSGSGSGLGSSSAVPESATPALLSTLGAALLIGRRNWTH
jgi:hypothetical protein